MEWIPAQFRALVATILSCSLTLGQLLLAGLAYAIRDWRQLQLASSVPFFFFFLCSWWIPESARWLIVNRRHETALKNLRRVARINGEKLEGEGTALEALRLEMQQEEERSGPTRRSALELFRTASMRVVTCCLMLAWFSNSFSFYHLALDLQRFGGISIFLVQLIFGAVDMPFRMLLATAANCLGRRLTQAACLSLGGLFILASIPVPQDMEVLQLTLTVLGKGLFSCSACCTYLYTTELYPTVIRQTGLGVTNMMARLGAVVAPMVQMTKAFGAFLPLLLFGIVPITAGILVNCLPETLGVPLADTMEQVEDSGGSALRGGCLRAHFLHSPLPPVGWRQWYQIRDRQRPGSLEAQPSVGTKGPGSGVDAAPGDVSQGGGSSKEGPAGAPVRLVSGAMAPSCPPPSVRYRDE